MEWVETTGKTIEEAKDAALDQLGVDEQDAEFEILEEPSKGLFGRTRGEARVRARIEPQQPRAKVERRDRRRKGKGEGESASRTSGAKSASRGGAKGAKAPAKSAARSAASSSDDTSTGTPGGTTTKSATKSTAKSAAKSTAKSATTSAGRPAAKSAGNGNGDAATPAKRARKSGTRSAGTVTTETPAGERTMTTDDDVNVEGQADLMTTFLEGLLEAFGAEGTVEREVIDEDTIELHVQGDDLGLLIGPKGQTLQAVQELARTYVQRKATGTHHGRVRIDIGGYRQRRREALERFTRQVADQVIDSGVQKALEPMNASDRKVVHDTVNEIDGVATSSEGDEPRRRVVISPA